MTQTSAVPSSLEFSEQLRDWLDLSAMLVLPSGEQCLTTAVSFMPYLLMIKKHGKRSRIHESSW